MLGQRRRCWPVYPFCPSQYFILLVPACWRHSTGGHNALNQSWVNVGPPSVMLAHIQRGAKHDTVTQYTGLMLAQRRIRWANISPALGQCLVFDHTEDSQHRLRSTDEQTKVNQLVPTSLWEGRHNKKTKIKKSWYIPPIPAYILHTLVLWGETKTLNWRKMLHTVDIHRSRIKATYMDLTTDIIIASKRHTSTCFISTWNCIHPSVITDYMTLNQL